MGTTVHDDITKSKFKYLTGGHVLSMEEITLDKY